MGWQIVVAGTEPTKNFFFHVTIWKTIVTVRARTFLLNRFYKKGSKSIVDF